jgi:hypothetical protein
MNKIYGEKELVDPATGEVIKTTYIVKKYKGDFNFHKVWLADLLNVLEVVGNKKLKVIRWILSNINNKTNQIIGTHQKISEKIGVSRVVVSQTFKLLQDADFLVKEQNGVYKINPLILVQGDNKKRQSILVEYKELKDDNKDE